jgi:hypothetical protein
MKNIIILSDLIGTKLQSRIEVKKIHDSLISISDKRVYIDFKGVTFMSRSFGDELCSLIDSFKKINIKLINEESTINTALKIISSNRNKPKKTDVNYTTLDFSNINNLSEFLATI